MSWVSDESLHAAANGWKPQLDIMPLARELLAARMVVRAAKAFPITGKGRQRAWGDALRKAITEYNATEFEQ